VYKPAAADFAALRAAMGKPEHPLVAFVTASGEVDLGLPAFRGPGESVLITTEAGAARLGALPPRTRVHVIAGGSRTGGVADGARPSSRAVLDAVVADSGARLVLSEGGPALLGAWLREGLVDELFLTVAPRLAGRSLDERRLALVEGAAFAPEDAPRVRLLSAKRADDYLFLRYGFRQPA
jgi:riboflavin biosynthesis pyrimidine reductase